MPRDHDASPKNQLVVKRNDRASPEEPLDMKHNHCASPINPPSMMRFRVGSTEIYPQTKANAAPHTPMKYWDVSQTSSFQPTHPPYICKICISTNLKRRPNFLHLLRSQKMQHSCQTSAIIALHSESIMLWRTMIVQHLESRSS